jgi:predicted nicotinamide N-methyase
MSSRANFIKKNCELLPGPLVAEISLYQATETKPLWHLEQEQLVRQGLEEPYWAFAWAGGQALARYLLDNPNIVAGKTVLSFACGAGGEAIAAKRAGASRVIAADIDPFARAAARLNTSANNVELEFEAANLLLSAPPSVDVILVGDVFYDNTIAKRLWPWLLQAIADQSTVLIGDPGRAYLPREELLTIARYHLDETSLFEDSDLRTATVWQMREDTLALA